MPTTKTILIAAEILKDLEHFDRPTQAVLADARRWLNGEFDQLWKMIDTLCTCYPEDEVHAAFALLEETCK